MEHREGTFSPEQKERKFTLSEILLKLEEYTIMIDGVVKAFQEKKYNAAFILLESLANTPALFQSLPESIQEKYGHHDLFQDFYNKVSSRIDLLLESVETFLDSEQTPEDLENLNSDLHFLERVQILWPYYKLIMEALVVRSYNLENESYTVPESLDEARLQKDISVQDFSEVVLKFFQAYPKRVYMDSVAVWLDPSLGDHKIHVCEGVLFNIIRNIIGNIINSDKQKQVSAHRLLLGFGISSGSTGEQYFEIQIWDDGNGMSLETIAEIFEEGMSGTESTGLGLAYVDQLVEAMNGKILVQSQVEKKEFLPNQPFSFEQMEKISTQDLVDEKKNMNTGFTLRFPLAI